MTVIILPLGFLIRNVLSEQKRLDILVNKTREEIAKDYATSVKFGLTLFTYIKFKPFLWQS